MRKWLGGATVLLLLVFAVASGCPIMAPSGATVATPAQIERISTFLRPGFTLDHAWAAPAQTHQNAQFLAAKIVGASRPAVAVWMISQAGNPQGVVLSVDANAREFSTAINPMQIKFDVSMADPPAQQLQDYVAEQDDP